MARRQREEEEMVSEGRMGERKREKEEGRGGGRRERENQIGTFIGSS